MRLINFFEDAKFRNGAYTSVSLLITPKTHLNRELEKTRYIKDSRERLKKIREIFEFSQNYPVTLKQDKTIDFQKLGFKTIENYLTEKSEGLFCNVWLEYAIKMGLEIECYLLDIFDKADELAKTDEYKAICYLIDEKYKNHTGIFDNPRYDELYNEEYNHIIYDMIQDRIISISKIEIIPVSDTIKRVTKKPLTWKANKNTIGTLFGILINSGIITGTKQDLSKGLCAMFSDLSESTILDNLNLKINSADKKILYDVQTETILKPWIDYLKNQKKKKEKPKSTTIQK